MERQPLLKHGHQVPRPRSAPPDFEEHYTQHPRSYQPQYHDSHDRQPQGYQPYKARHVQESDEEEEREGERLLQNVLFYDDSFKNQGSYSREISQPGFQRCPADPNQGRSSRSDSQDPSPSRSTSGFQDPASDVPKDQKRRMGLITLVAFFVSCAGRVHAPVMKLYTYQVYTDVIYGNASLGQSVSKEPCVNASGSKSDLDVMRAEVQDKTADLLKLLELVSGAIGIVSNLVLGSYSDVIGRRFLLLVPIIGHFLRNASAPVIIYWDFGLPALYVGYVIDGLCGGAIGIALGYYAYTADITKGDKQRTMGMAIIGATTTLSTAAMSIAVSIFIDDTGFLYPSLMAAGLLLVSVFIVVVLLPETVTRDRKSGASSPLQSAKRMLGLFVLKNHPYQTTFLVLGLLSFFLVTFPLYGVIERWSDNVQEWTQVSFSGPTARRMVLPLLPARPPDDFPSRGTDDGDFVYSCQVKGLYVMEEPFCMDALTSGIRSAISGVVQELGGLGLIKVLQNVVVTPGLVIIGCLSVITGDVITGLATSTLMLYLSDVAGIATPLITPSLRSMMSRMVPPDRQGTLMAWIAMIESVCKCSAQMAFTPIYEATLPFMEGFVFLIVASTRIFIVIIQLLYIYLLNKSQRKKFESVSVQTDIVVEVDDDTS